MDMKATIQLQHNLEFLESSRRFLIHQGGVRSGKTISILQAIIIASYKWPGLKTTIVRKTMPALRKTAMADFFSILEQQGIYDESKHNKTSNTYAIGTSVVEFMSIDQPQKVRGGRRDVLFMNECNEISEEEFRQLGLRTHAGLTPFAGPTGKVMMDYNPSDAAGWFYDLMEKRPDDVQYHRTTYLDNPFLSEAQVDEIERLAEGDADFWKSFGLGERTGSRTTIYTHWKLGDFPETGKKCYGLDFGYNHPTALVEVASFEDGFYVRELLYRSGLSTSEMATAVAVLVEKNVPVYCDSARPDSIAELRLMSVNAIKATKDVIAGINYVKSKPVIIDPGSVNLIKELRVYKWKTDRMTGESLEVPVEVFDDACDAMRYGIYSSRSQKSFTEMYSFGG